MGNSDPAMVHNYKNPYLRISFKEFLKLVSCKGSIGRQVTCMKFTKESLLGQVGKCEPICPKITQIRISECSFRISFWNVEPYRGISSRHNKYTWNFPKNDLFESLHHVETQGICENLENIPSYIPRRIFLPVYRYGCPNSGAQKRKFMFYNRIFFFLLNPSKVYSQVRKNTLLIVNHSKTWEAPGL